MSAATDRLLNKYNGRIYDSSDNPGGLDGPGGMEANYLNVAADVATVGVEVAGGLQTTSALRDAVATDRASVAADRAAVAADRTTTQGLLGQAQAARDGAAADRVLAQNSIGTATNVLVPAINHRLASAWDGTGQPTAYALTNVVNVARYDTRQDSDFGRWRRGKAARASSWWNESLNTATRGPKREFPVVALLVLTQSMFVIYDAHDLDGNGSPRMWMVFNNLNGALVFSPPAWALNKVAARNGWLLFANNGSGAIGMFRLDFLRDAGDRIHPGGTYFRSNIANRNVGVAAERLVSAITALPHGLVNDVDVRVLPGALLDPVSRLPTPTMLVSTSAGFSLVWPNGQVTTVTYGSGFARAQFWGDHRIMAQYGGTNSFSLGPIPYATMADGSWPRIYLDGSTTTLRHLGTTVYGMLAACPGAIGHDNGLTLIAEDRGNTLNSLVAFVTKSFATGWMPGDCRMATLCEGVGSNGASPGELFGNGDFASSVGWVMNGSWGIDTANRVANCAATGGWLKKAVTLAANSTYTFTFDATITGGGYLACAVFDADGGSNQLNAIGGGVSASGSFVLSVTTGAASAMAGIYFSGGTGNGAAVRNFKLRKVGTFTDSITGTGELIGSGDGTSTAGWTTSNATPASVSGELEFTTAASGTAYGRYAIATVVGETYCLQSVARCAAGTPGFTINAYPSDYAASLGGVTVAASTTTSTAIQPIYFRASTTTTYIQATMAATAAGQKFYLDNVSCKEAVPDRGYKGKGLIVNGTLNRAAVGANNDVVAYSGYGAGKYFSQPYNADLDPGTGDLCVALWHRASNGSGWLVYRADAAGGALYRIGHNVSGISFFISDGTTSQAINTTSGFSDGAWHLGLFIRRAATGKLEYWLDGVLAASADASGVGSLSKNTAIMTIGAAVDGSTPAASAEMALVRVSTYAPTPAQIRRMYADEAVLFLPGARAFLGGVSSSVQALALDEDAGVLNIATADGVSQFAGLRRVGRLTAAAGTAFTVSSVSAVSAGGGAVMIGTANEAGLVTELQPVKDELRQPAQAANGNDCLVEVTTLGAAPAVLGKFFVSEGESLLIDIDVQGVEASLTPSVACSYSLKGRVQRSYGGNVTLPTAPLKFILDSTNTALDVSLSIDTALNAASVAVTGLSGKNMVWRGAARINRIGGTNAAA